MLVAAWCSIEFSLNQSLLSPNSASIALKVAVARQGGEAACRLVLCLPRVLRRRNVARPGMRPGSIVRPLGRRRRRKPQAGDMNSGLKKTRGHPSAELAARYAMPTGFGAPAAKAMTTPATLPPGVAFTQAPFGMMEPPHGALPTGFGGVMCPTRANRLRPRRLVYWPILLIMGVRV